MAEQNTLVGSVFPTVDVYIWDQDKPQKTNTEALFKDKKVVLFAIPGAFTPTCTNSHCPSFVANGKKLLERGVDLVAMTAVNDAFVLKAFSDQQRATGVITMIADGNGELAKKLGLAKDVSSFGLGIRSHRYAMIIDNLKITWVGVDISGYENSTPDKVLSAL